MRKAEETGKRERARKQRKREMREEKETERAMPVSLPWAHSDLLFRLYVYSVAAQHLAALGQDERYLALADKLWKMTGFAKFDPAKGAKVSYPLLRPTAFLSSTIALSDITHHYTVPCASITHWPHFVTQCIMLLRRSTIPCHREGLVLGTQLIQSVLHSHFHLFQPQQPK